MYQVKIFVDRKFQRKFGNYADRRRCGIMGLKREENDFGSFGYSFDDSIHYGLMVTLAH